MTAQSLLFITLLLLCCSNTAFADCISPQVWNPYNGICEDNICDPGFIYNPYSAACEASPCSYPQIWSDVNARCEDTSCTSPQELNPNTGLCETPPACMPWQAFNVFIWTCEDVCVYPEVYNSSTGVCTPSNCTSSQELNPNTGLCETPPTCIYPNVWTPSLWSCQSPCVAPLVWNSTAGACEGQCASPRIWNFTTQRCEDTSCTSPQELNPNSGLCETPPTCQSWQIWNSQTWQCVSTLSVILSHSIVDDIQPRVYYSVQKGSGFSKVRIYHDLNLVYEGTINTGSVDVGCTVRGAHTYTVVVEDSIGTVQTRSASGSYTHTKSKNNTYITVPDTATVSGSCPTKIVNSGFTTYAVRTSRGVGVGLSMSCPYEPGTTYSVQKSVVIPFKKSAGVISMCCNYTVPDYQFLWNGYTCYCPTAGSSGGICVSLNPFDTPYIPETGKQQTGGSGHQKGVVITKTGRGWRARGGWETRVQ